MEPESSRWQSLEFLQQLALFEMGVYALLSSMRVRLVYLTQKARSDEGLLGLINLEFYDNESGWTLVALFLLFLGALLAYRRVFLPSGWVIRLSGLAFLALSYLLMHTLVGLAFLGLGVFYAHPSRAKHFGISAQNRIKCGLVALGLLVFLLIADEQFPFILKVFKVFCC